MRYMFYLSTGATVMVNIPDNFFEILTNPPAGSNWFVDDDGTAVHLESIIAMAPAKDPAPETITDGQGDVWRRHDDGSDTYSLTGKSNVRWTKEEIRDQCGIQAYRST